MLCSAYALKKLFLVSSNRPDFPFDEKCSDLAEVRRFFAKKSFPLLDRAGSGFGYM